MYWAFAFYFLGLLLAAMPLGLAAGNATSSRWYVATTGDDANTCASAAAPCASIGRALAAAGAGDTIAVASGTYTGSGDQVVRIENAVVLSGGWNADFSAQTGTSIIDGQNARRGIFVGNADVVIENFVIQHGRPTGAYQSVGSPNCGGGIFTAGRLRIDNSTVAHNVGGAAGGSGLPGGGGICNWFLGGAGAGELTLNNTTIADNRVDGAFSGGAIMNASGFVALNSSTISGNSASEIGGIYNMGTLALRNSIVAGNINGDCGNHTIGHTTDLGYNLIQDGSCLAAGTSRSGDPRLDALQDNGGSTPTLALLPGSPAVDAGNPGGCAGSAGVLDTDQRGFARLGRCDIGAFEAQALNSSAKYPVSGTVAAGGRITYTIVLANGSTGPIGAAYVTDTLPLSVTYVANSLIATGGSPRYADGVVTWTGPVAAAATTILTYAVHVDSRALRDHTLVNTALITTGSERLRRTSSHTIQGSLGPAADPTKATRPWVGLRLEDKTQIGTSNSALDIAVHPTTPAKIYLAGYNPFMFSEDGGATWITKTVGLADMSGHATTVAVDRTSSRLFLGTSSGEIFRSEDGGRTWDMKVGSGPNISVLAVHPTTPTIVFAGRAGDPIYRSDDGGNTWSVPIFAEPIHVEIRQFVFDPSNPAKVYAPASLPGLLVSTDAGATWTNTGLSTEWLAIDPNDPDTFYRTGPGGLTRSTDHGASWKSIPLPPYSFERIFINPADSDVLYLWSLSYPPYRSIDRGATWKPLDWIPGGSMSSVWAFTMNQADPARLYAYAADRVSGDWDLFVVGEMVLLPILARAAGSP